MGDRILGPAYPALLAPGLRVIHDGEPATLIGVDGSWWVVADSQCIPGDRIDAVVRLWPARESGGARYALEALQIDYADPHTRDRVGRAMPERADDAALARVAEVLERASVIPGEPIVDMPEVLRAVAAAVWGAR